MLIMDDEEVVTDVAQQMLQYLGYESSVVQTGEEAVAKYREAFVAGEPYSLVIMDLNIPQGMGGGEAVKHILDIDHNAKVVVASGYSDDSIMQDFKNYGFVGAIGKPFSLKRLEEIIQANVH